MFRHSLNYVPWKRRTELAADLKQIYRSYSGKNLVQVVQVVQVVQIEREVAK